MSLTAGTKLGPYEILAPLGAGGMGEVYRARDTRLGRDVAVKVLPERLISSPDFRQRFEREARAISSLQHPHICVLHDIGHDEAAGEFLVMEFLEGETVAARLKKGKLPLQELLKIGMEIADALDKAHRKGLVHRDLKPANIMLTKNGAKLMDFGLAKPTALIAAGGTASAPLLSAAMTVDGPSPASPITSAGSVIGTIQYMSPEQIEGKEADARSDIFALGATLYEMATGARAFQGRSQISVASAILEKDPEPISRTQPLAPPALDRVLAQCLAKNPDDRFQSAHDMGLALKWISVEAGSPRQIETGGVKPPLQRAWLWATMAAMAIAGALVVYLLTPRPAAGERMQFAIPVQAEVSNLALSADGKMLALVGLDSASGQEMLCFERVGSALSTRLAGTEGASYPFWSPDDTDIGFFANGQLQRISITGGPPQVIAPASHGRGGSWGCKGVIIYAPDAGGPLWRVNVDGSGAAPLTDKSFVRGEGSHRWPMFLPDGRQFLFFATAFASGATGVTNGIYLSSLSGSQKKLVLANDSNFSFANGHLYTEDDRNDLVAVPFSIAEGKVAGEPRVIAEHVGYESSVQYGLLSAGGNDTAVYGAGSGGVISALTWYDRTGKALGRVVEPAIEANPSLSPDGKRAVVDIANPNSTNVDVWIEDLEHGTASRLTFDPTEDATGVWSRDGQTIAYRSNSRAGAGSIEIKKATGLEEARAVVVTRIQDDIMPNSWSLDDKTILCTYEPAQGGASLELVDVASGKMTPFTSSKASETNGMISPDGKRVAYASNETGEWEIYVTTFPGTQGKWQVSRGGGVEPRWQGDGKAIYYLDPKGVLTAVPVTAQGTFSAGTPSPLFPAHGRLPVSDTDIFTYDVTKDGKHFLVNSYLKPDHVEPLTVVLNAMAGTRK